MRIVGYLSLIFLSLGGAHHLCAHGVPINLFVDGPTNQLIVPFEYDTGLVPHPPPNQYTSTLPGISVSHESNLLGQVPFDTLIHFDVIQSLLYWDGTEVTATDATIRIFAPTHDNAFTPHNSPVPFYDVTASSGTLTGMTWGEWPGGSFWQADGEFILPEEADRGVYGIVVQLSMDGVEATDPLLITQNVDPDFDLNGAVGRAALLSHVVPEPSTATMLVSVLCLAALLLVYKRVMRQHSLTIGRARS